MSEDLELLGELIDGFLEEAPELAQALDAQLTAAEAEASAEALDSLAHALDTFKQRAAFLEFEALEDLAEAMLGAVAAVQGGTVGYSVAAAPLRQGQDLVLGALAQLEKHDMGAVDDGGCLQTLAEVATGRAQDEGIGTTPEGDEAESLPPEALVALTLEPSADDEDLAPPADGGDEVEVTADRTPGDPKPTGPPVEEEAGPAAPSGEVSATAEQPGSSPEEIPALEEIEVAEGPVPAEAADFVPDFLTEAGEILEKLDEDLVHLEDAPGDLDLLNEIFRGAHTIKGTSAFLGFSQMSDLTHKMENVLDLLRKGEMALSPTIMDVILEGVDQIKVFMADIAAGAIVRREIDDLRGRLAVLAATRGASSGAPAPPSGGDVASAPEPVEAEPPTPPEAAAPDETTPPMSPKAPEAISQAASSQVDQVIRVGVERIDQIMNLAEELVLGRNRLLQLNDELQQEHGEDELAGRLNEATSQVGMLTGELQESVMTMRMLPVTRVFSRFPRMVRDLARDLGKQIELVLEDNDTEIDKSVADEIGDPLVHLIRNAVDHGVESAEERQASDKPSKGTVVLSATHEGNHIVICIRDDGAGMDAEKLKAKAVERGIITEVEAGRMTDGDAYNLIFAPGFSMAKQVTDVSGRGVGMDVVKTNITRLNGTIEINSVAGEGTEVSIRLPLTLAIITGLQVSVGEEVFIAPLTSVIEATKIELSDIESLQGRKVVLSRDKVLPLIDVREALEVDGGVPPSDMRYVVVAGLAERRVGLLVDRLIGQVDVVIKALGEYVGAATGIAGATILGDGRVRLILDVGELMDMAAAEEAVGDRRGTTVTADVVGA